MNIIRIEGFEYTARDIRGNCPDHGTPLVNTPYILPSLKLPGKLLHLAESGIWGIGYCPMYKHFAKWFLPDIEHRPGATEENPLGYLINIDLDKIDILG